MRDKLIELLKACCYVGKDCNMDCDVCTADHLIANGVVVQRKGEPVKRVVMQLCNSDGEVVEEYYGYCCPFCDEEAVGDYCPNCGARMDGDT